MQRLVWGKSGHPNSLKTRTFSDKIAVSRFLDFCTHDSDRTADLAACRERASLNERSNFFRKIRNFASHRTQISFISLAIPPRTEGRFAIVTDVRRDAVDAGDVKRRMTLRADGKVVWS